MIYSSKENRADYAYPLLGNGEISFQVNGDGVMEPKEKVCEKEELHLNLIWRMAHRYNADKRPLVSFGRFTHNLPKSENFTQELDMQKGIIYCESEYPQGEVKTEIFIHKNENIICIKKKFIGEFKGYSFDYLFCGRDYYSCPERSSFVVSNINNGFCLEYDIDGYEHYHSNIYIQSNKFLIREVKDNKLSLIGDYRDESVCFFIEFSGNAPTERDYNTLRGQHTKIWNDFWSEGYVNFGDLALDKAYKAAQYSFFSQMTKWSMPVGLGDKHWEARFFAFDEYYSFYALLTSNHLSLAKRIPEYRVGGLSVARQRVSGPGVKQAFYPWLTIEDFSDAPSPGFWEDHIFHTPMICAAVFEYYEYTGDVEFLKRAYEMIVLCCKYMINQRIYNVGGEIFLGKCTDFERLGPSVERAHASTCSAIRLLDVTAHAADVLGVDSEFARQCEFLSGALKNSLPTVEGKYIPHLNCAQKSIGVFFGAYPYNCLDRDDKKLISAMCDYEDFENDYGNCYAVGNNVSSWYASLKAAAWSYVGQKEKAYKSLCHATTTIGCFGETCEISEPPKILYRPWFTTAAGAFVSACNNMLLRVEGEDIYLLDGMPKEMETVSFRLATTANRVVEAQISNSSLKKLFVSGKATVHLPDWLDTSAFGNKQEIKFEEKTV